MLASSNCSPWLTEQQFSSLMSIRAASLLLQSSNYICAEFANRWCQELLPSRLWHRAERHPLTNVGDSALLITRPCLVFHVV